MSEERTIAVEQAAVALLSEAKAQGVDLAALADKAKVGVMGSATYTKVGANHKAASCEAIDYLLQGVK